jgi:hypothetical protein
MVEPSVGDRGELSIAAGLIYTVDALRLKKIKGSDSKINYNPNYPEYSFSSDIPCLEFLEAISGQTAQHRKVLEGFMVNFTHFMSVLEFSDEIAFLAYERGAAVVLQKGAEAVDLVVVIYHPVRKVYGLILFQVKNYNDFISEYEAFQLLVKCCGFPDIVEAGDSFDFDAIVSVVAAAGGVSLEEPTIAAINKVIAFPLRKTRKSSQDDRLVLTTSINSFVLLSDQSREYLWNISSSFQSPSKRHGNVLKFIREFGEVGYRSYLKFHLHA